MERTFGQNLVGLGFADSLDCQQCLFGCEGDRFNSVEPSILKLLGV